MPQLDEELAEFAQVTLRRLLPDAFRSQPTEQSALVNLLVRQEEAAAATRQREEARAEAAKQPKTVNELWTEAQRRRACLLFNNATPSALPPLHAHVAAAAKEQRRLIIEASYKEAAAAAGNADFAPLITPVISRRIQDGSWAGHDQDDFAGGITLFMMIPPDMSLLQESSLAEELEELVKSHDLILSGHQAISFKDSKEVTAQTTKIVLPTNFDMAARMLVCYGILLGQVFGADHDLTRTTSKPIFQNAAGLW